MAYACPVCGVAQADGVHLADHLAVRAILHGDDHESWLDEHAPGWRSESPEAVATVAVEHAGETGDPVAGDEVIEPESPAPAHAVDPTTLDAETRRALEDALAMTRQWREGGMEREE